MLTVNAASGFGSGVVAGGYRYWRIRFDATPYYASQWHAVAEVEYFTSAGQIAYGTLAGLTIAGAVNLNATGIALSYNGATDVTHGACTFTSGEDGHFAYGVDFTVNTDITQMKAYGPNNFAFHYNWDTNLYLEYSEDDSTWVVAASDTDGVGTSTSNIITLTV